MKDDKEIKEIENLENSESLLKIGNLYDTKKVSDYLENAIGKLQKLYEDRINGFAERENEPNMGKMEEIEGVGNEGKEIKKQNEKIKKTSKRRHPALDIMKTDSELKADAEINKGKDNLNKINKWNRENKANNESDVVQNWSDKEKSKNKGAMWQKGGLNL